LKDECILGIPEWGGGGVKRKWEGKGRSFIIQSVYASLPVQLFMSVYSIHRNSFQSYSSIEIKNCMLSRNPFSCHVQYIKESVWSDFAPFILTNCKIIGVLLMNVMSDQVITL
jgi:hypothetical protein